LKRAVLTLDCSTSAIRKDCAFDELEMALMLRNTLQLHAAAH
jgi:hypothetical protein